MSIFTSVKIIGTLSILTSFAVGLFILIKRKNSRAALPLACLMFVNMVYAHAVTMELISTTLESTYFWLKVEYIGSCFVPVFWLLFSRSFVNDSLKMTLKTLIPWSIVPLLTIILVWTNDYHHLVYTSVDLFNTTVPLSCINTSKNVWYWVATLYFFSLAFYGALTIISRISKASGKFRFQIIITFIAVTLAWTGRFLMLFDWWPYAIDITPIGIALSGCLLSWNVIKFNMFDLVPIIRDIVVDAITESVIVLDRKVRLVDTNKAAKILFPVLKTLKPGTTLTANLLAPLDATTTGAKKQVFALAGNGKQNHYQARLVDITDDQGYKRGHLVIINDITEMTELINRMEQLATTDELTQIPNRRYFFSLAAIELDRAKRKSQAISFAMFDLDHFKRINDTLGHAAGDQALKTICVECHMALRSCDILCRYGGEEFIFILPETPPHAALEIVERVRKRIAETVFQYENESFSITASFGLSGSDKPPYLELQEYLKRADDALYQAKALGRNRTIMDKQLQ